MCRTDISYARTHCFCSTSSAVSRSHTPHLYALRPGWYGERGTEEEGARRQVVSRSGARVSPRSSSSFPPLSVVCLCEREGGSILRPSTPPSFEVVCDPESECDPQSVSEGVAPPSLPSLSPLPLSPVSLCSSAPLAPHASPSLPPSLPLSFYSISLSPSTPSPSLLPLHRPLSLPLHPPLSLPPSLSRSLALWFGLAGAGWAVCLGGAGAGADEGRAAHEAGARGGAAGPRRPPPPRQHHVDSLPPCPAHSLSSLCDNATPPLSSLPSPLLSLLLCAHVMSPPPLSRLPLLVLSSSEREQESPLACQRLVSSPPCPPPSCLLWRNRETERQRDSDREREAEWAAR
eukprot:2902641-Rhodomonas_salina.2